MPIGAWEIALIVVVILLLFGSTKLPKIARSMGRGAREFKETVTDQAVELKEATVDVPKQFKDGMNPLKPNEQDEEEAVPCAGAGSGARAGRGGRQAGRAQALGLAPHAQPVFSVSSPLPSPSPGARRRDCLTVVLISSTSGIG